jgi:hypothetical protein
MSKIGMILAAIGIAAIGGGAEPQPAGPRLAVGDRSVSGERLVPYTNRWKFTQQKPGGPAVDAGLWSDSLERTTVDGHPALKRTQTVRYAGRDIRIRIVDVFDPATMEPFTFDYSRSSDGNRRHVDFRHARVTYRHTEKSGAREETATVDLDRPVFNFYGLYGVLVSTLPLAQGYAAEIPALDTEKMAVDWVPVRVVGRETVEAGPGKTADAWVVETTPRLYGKMTWWVTKTAPYVIKAVLEVPKSEDGSKEIAAVITYTMV